MTDASDNSLTFSAKVNRLFDVYRSRDESEQPVEAVARSVSKIIGRPIAAAEIRALRYEDAAIPDADILRGLIGHFGVPIEYLTTTGKKAEHLDKQLRLLAAARDAGVRRLALRGSMPNDALDDVIAVIDKISAED